MSWREKDLQEYNWTQFNNNGTLYFLSTTYFLNLLVLDTLKHPPWFISHYVKKINQHDSYWMKKKHLEPRKKLL